MSNFSQEEFEQALRQCETEPIHQIGQIQPHGAMLVLSSDSRRIVLQASDNLDEFFDLYVDDICGMPLAELIGDTKAEQIEQLIQDANVNNPVTGVISLTQRQVKSNLQARVFCSENMFILELMRDVGAYQAKHLTDLLLPLQRSLLRLNTENDTYRYFERIAQIVRDLTEFDRVMVYRFDADWEGEVIAESRVDDAHSYLGTHFPASDIPPQARQLYTSNPVRQIADTEAKPVPVLPALNPATRQPLDMTYSVLRSLSPVHVEYLRNMGVRASMSISLLQNGRLWGLIACHHITPKRLSNALLEAAAFISQTVSAKLTLIEFHEQMNLGMEASRIIGELLKNITTAPEGTVLRHLLPDLLVLLGASGVIMAVEGKHYAYGEVPEPAVIGDLFAWLSSQSATELFSCDYLAQHFAPSIAYADIAAGLLATPLSIEMSNCILWLRKEKLRTVRWAGNPEKIFLKDPFGVRLSPRKSFETWTESWRGRSASWSHAEIQTAKSIALALTQGLAQKNQLEQAQAERRRADEKLRQADQFLAIFENSPIAVQISNISTSKVVFANQRYAELIGSVPDKVIAANPKQYYANPQDYDEVLETIFRDEQVTDKLVELRIPVEHSLPKWALASYLQLDFQHEPSVLAWFYDITERNLSNQKIAAANKKLQKLALRLDNVREEERVRISRELHDEMGAILTALKMSIHWLVTKLPAEMVPLVEEAEHIDKLLTDAIYTMHHVVSQLMPTLLHDLGFTAATDRFVQNFQNNTKIECTLVLPEEEVALNDNQSSAMFRVLPGITQQYRETRPGQQGKHPIYRQGTFVNSVGEGQWNWF